MKKSLLKSTGIVSSMTLLSRISGFVRDMVVAQFFGALAGMDAFLVAFKIPNFMRRLFAEGAFSQAFVPVLSEYKSQRSVDEMKQLIADMSGVLGGCLLFVVIASVLLAPLLVFIFAPGFYFNGGRYDLATTMLRITFPYLLFISLAALNGAILNINNRFAIPALTPVFLNLVMIAAAYGLSPHMAEPIYGLAWGVFAAGIVQWLFQLPFVKQLNLLAMPRWRLDPGVKRVLKLMVPAIFGVSVAQLSILLDTAFASFLVVGSVSWLYYSDRLVQFPLGVFGVAIATVILPHLSKQFAHKSEEDFSKALDWGLQLLLLIGIPASVGLFVLAGPLLSSLFEYGKFSAHDVVMAQKSLMAFAVGLPAFMAIKVLASGFYARQNIKTPVRIAVVALIINMVLNAALIYPLRHAGLALATSLASIVNSGMLLFTLRKQQIYQPKKPWKGFLFRLFIANGLMALSMGWYSPNLTIWSGWTFGQRLWHLLVAMTLGMSVYAVSLFLQGIRPSRFKLD